MITILQPGVAKYKNGPLISDISSKFLKWTTYGDPEFTGKPKVGTLATVDTDSHFYLYLITDIEGNEVTFTSMSLFVSIAANTLVLRYGGENKWTDVHQKHRVDVKLGEWHEYDTRPY